MKKAIELFNKLGITHYTERHLNIVLNYFELDPDEWDAEQLLDLLGEWNHKDLKITKQFLDIKQ